MLFFFMVISHFGGCIQTEHTRRPKIAAAVATTVVVAIATKNQQQIGLTPLCIIGVLGVGIEKRYYRFEYLELQEIIKHTDMSIGL